MNNLLHANISYVDHFLSFCQPPGSFVCMCLFGEKYMHDFIKCMHGLVLYVCVCRVCIRKGIISFYSIIIHAHTDTEENKSWVMFGNCTRKRSRPPYVTKVETSREVNKFPLIYTKIRKWMTHILKVTIFEGNFRWLSVDTENVRIFLKLHCKST